MSGCYQCGHITGSAQSLCEDCYSRRFHQVPKEKQVLDVPAEGIELSERERGLALTGGAFVYVIIVLVLGVSVPYLEYSRKVAAARSSTSPRYDFVTLDEVGSFAEDLEVSTAAVRASHRAADERHAALPAS